MSRSNSGITNGNSNFPKTVNEYLGLTKKTTTEDVSLFDPLSLEDVIFRYENKIGQLDLNNGRFLPNYADPINFVSVDEYTNFLKKARMIYIFGLDKFISAKNKSIKFAGKEVEYDILQKIVKEVGWNNIISFSQQNGKSADVLFKYEGYIIPTEIKLADGDRANQLRAIKYDTTVIRSNGYYYVVPPNRLTSLVSGGRGQHGVSPYESKSLGGWNNPEGIRREFLVSEEKIVEEIIKAFHCGKSDNEAKKRIEKIKELTDTYEKGIRKVENEHQI